MCVITYPCGFDIDKVVSIEIFAPREMYLEYHKYKVAFSVHIWSPFARNALNSCIYKVR